MAEFRVELDAFSGPMDLLLHLVREQEVDIRDVSISLLLEGYLAYLERLGEIDVNEAADFLVMASNLLEIKSREILPREEVDLEEVLDPREDLLRHLLDYKVFREASRILGERWRRRGLMHGKGLRERVQGEAEEEELDLEDLDTWALLQLYAGLADQVGLNRTFRVKGERKPLSYYLSFLLERLQREKRASFDKLFDPSEGRMGLVAVFVALLEIVRLGYARCLQEEVMGPILVEWSGPKGCTAEEILAAEESAGLPPGQPLQADPGEESGAGV